MLIFIIRNHQTLTKKENANERQVLIEQFGKKTNFTSYSIHTCLLCPG